jgi:hypothetical protein
MMKHNKIFAVGMLTVLLAMGLALAGCDLSAGGSGTPTTGGSVKPAAPYISGYYTATETVITWDSVWGAEEYHVYTSTQENTTSWYRIATTSSTSYTHYTTQSYNYAVRAENSSGISSFSNTINTY